MALSLLFSVLIFAHTTRSAPHQLELLDRGLVALKANENQVYLSWRLLASDSEGTAFNVYRSADGGPAVKLTMEAVSLTTDFVDNAADLSLANEYYVRAVVDGVELAASDTVSIDADAEVRQYLSLPLQVPEGGETASGNFEYSANDLSVGDLDGDGAYEVVVKWYPSNAKDNSQSGFTGNTLLDAYTLSGELLWRIDLGVNIRSGSHYTQFMVYDLDGDGKAEIACRTAEGSMDASGAYIAQPENWQGDVALSEIPVDHEADRRNSGGYILEGPEFLTIFDGLTGMELVSTLYEPQRVPGTYFPTTAEINQYWGDSYGNRIDRFNAAVAYLDGTRPSLVMCRGYYTRTALVAYDWRGGVLSKRWMFDTLDEAVSDTYRGQGAHSITVGDVDLDGKDEIVYGASTIDDDGTGLYNTNLGHGDALHLSDMDPDRSGLEVWMPHESPSSYGANGSELHDAATGEIIFGVGGGGADVGRGVAADIDPRYRGFETWASRGGMHSVSGEAIETVSLPSMNFLVWWDADPLREMLNNTTISKWNWSVGSQEAIFTDDGILSNNSTKATPNLSGDILGDWREEVIWRNVDSTELRIYSTVIPANNRLVTLMHDRQYRLAIAWQNVGYNQPPHTGFYLGDGMLPPARPDFYYARTSVDPEVSLVSPVDGEVYKIGDEVAMVAEASDTDGAVSSVEFYEDAKFYGMDLTDPYTAIWDATEGGSFELRAVATDDEGLQGVSAPLVVTVTHNDVYDDAIAWSPWTPRGTRVDGYQGDGYAILGRPWHFLLYENVDGGLDGGHKTLRIRYSTKSRGKEKLYVCVNGRFVRLRLNESHSRSRSRSHSHSRSRSHSQDAWQYAETTIELLPGTENTIFMFARGGTILVDGIEVEGVLRNQDPEIQLINPVDGYTNLEGTDLFLSALAKDVGGAVAQVDFLVNDSVLTTDLSDPYEYIWNDIPEGDYAIKATATDDLGAVVESDTVNVLINNPPSVEIVNPSTGAYTLVSEALPVDVEASDGVGSVEQVELLQDGESLGVSAGPEFGFEWTPSEVGQISLQAVATDNRGTTASSSDVAVTVLPAGYEADYQLEDGGLVGGSGAAADTAGFNGTGYATLPSGDAQIQLKQVDGGSGSMALLRIRFANPEATSRVGAVLVNGNSFAVEYDSTDSAFSTLVVPAPLDAGKSNTILFTAAGEGELYIDELTVRGLQSEADHTYHAENGVRTGSMVLESSNTGFNGIGYMNFPGSEGILEFPTVDGGLGGTKTLSVRYALGSGSRAGTLSINGVSQAIDFVASGSWTGYVTMDIEIELNPGNSNSIVIESIGNDLANVDEVIVRDVGALSDVPAVTLLTPADPAIEWRWGDTMSITASATVASGSIEKVEYYAMDPVVKVGEASGEPFAYDWFVLPGEYEIFARAYSDNGSVAESYGYLMDVSFDNDLPVAEITSPGEGTVLLDGDDVTIEVAASDPDGSVALVEFYVDDVLVAADTSAPYSHTLSALAAGGYQVKVRAQDNLGSYSYVDVVQLGVFYATGGDLIQEAEEGIVAGSFELNYDSRLAGPVGEVNAVKAISSSSDEGTDLPGTDYLEMRFNIPVRGYYRIKSSVASPDGSSDSMYVAIDGADPFQNRWVTAISSSFTEDYVRSDSQDPLLIFWEAGGHFVRFGYREPLKLDYFEVELVNEAPLAQPFFTEGGEAYQEAENAAEIGGNFTVVEDSAASGGYAIETGGSLSPTPNYALFQFNVEYAGFYALKAGVKTVLLNGTTDSFYVSIDGASNSQHVWDTEQSDTVYVEDYATSRTAGDPLLFFLYPGGHTIRIGDREGPFLDWVELEYQGDGL
ncbi:Ig-like domain-containing protein [Pelagicoccus albus]|nr:Ig-like domain-containing protein [Pelagicoccus albus]